MSHDLTSLHVHHICLSGKQFYKVHVMEPSLMEAGLVVANTDWECSVMVRDNTQKFKVQYTCHLDIASQDVQGRPGPS